MKNLLLNENYYWEIIEKINWYEITKLYKEDAINKVKDYCLNYLTNDEIINLFNFIINKRDILIDEIKGKDYHNIYNLTDIELYDICSHIVGLGKQMYYTLLNNVEHVNLFFNDYIKSYEYGFDCALYEMNTQL